MSPLTLAHLAWWRLRARPFQELLAGAGIAIGVALAFAVMVANGSIAGSSEAVVHAVVGSADWQLASRDDNGTDGSLMNLMQRLPHVRLAAPVLDQRSVLAVGDRQVPADVASIDPALARMSGRFLPFASIHGALLTTAAARALGFPATGPLPKVTVKLRGRAVRMPVVAVLGDQTVGALASVPVAILSLPQLQLVARLPHRITRILVAADPGMRAVVRAELAPLAAVHHLALDRADSETALLKQALGPSDWTTGFFAAISALLGFMLAFNATMLTAPERRRMIADLRLQGWQDRHIVAMIASQALVFGMVASLGGLGIGLILARGAFSASPHYLAPAFLPGASTVVTATPIIVALAGGILACLLASAAPLLDMRSRTALDDAVRSRGDDERPQRTWRMLAISLAAATAAVLVLLASPALAIVAVALFALSTVCATPAVLAVAVRAAAALAERAGWARMLTVAVFGLRAATTRSIALAATGAVAIFGCVSIGGARSDLLRGIGAYTNDYVSTADLWVINPQDNQATDPIDTRGIAQRIAAVPGVRSVRAYRGSFLDWRGRRVWIIGRPRTDQAMLPASQMRAGSLALATVRLRSGGWAAISQQLAALQHAQLGSMISIPSPTGHLRLRVAAITTNLGWTPGAIIMNADDYRRGWAAPPSALEVDTARGADVRTVQAAVARAGGPGLVVQTPRERAAEINASAQQGLERLSQISTLLLIGAALALAAAMSAAIWQRRPSLAGMRTHGFAPQMLWRVLLIEAAIVLAAGCLTGIVVGIAGQTGIDRYLVVVTGFPVKSVPAGRDALVTFATVMAAALAVIAISGWRAAQVGPGLGVVPE